jgi:hypothetical protein
MSRIHTGPRGGRYKLSRGRKIYVFEKRPREKQQRRRRTLRMESVPLLPSKQLPDSTPLGPYLNEHVPYLYVAPSKHTIVLDGYVIIRGSSGSSFSLEKDFSFAPFNGNEIPDISPEEGLGMLDSELVFPNGASLEPIDAMMFKYVNVFGDKSKWHALGVTSRTLKDLLKELITDVPDQPVSTTPNIIHWFIFLNEMPAFINLMTTSDLEVGVRNVFNERAWNIDNGLDVRTLALNIGPATAGIPLSQLTVSGGKNRCAFTPLSKTSRKDDDCPKLDYDKQIKTIVDSVKRVKKLFETLQENKGINNLGYRFLLNYWMYRVFNIDTLQNKFPLNKLQQIRSLMSFASGVKPTIKIPAESTKSFEPLSTIGLYNGMRYPNCVENSVFKLLQVLSYDYKSNKFNPDLLSSVSSPLRDYLNALNNGTEYDNISWNNVVCSLPGVDYKSDKAYNIRSNVDNVLMVLNTLTDSRYETLKDWVVGISRNNPNVYDIVTTDSFIKIKDTYDFEVMEGHSTFSVISETEGAFEKTLATKLQLESLFFIAHFGFLSPFFSERYVTALIQNRTDFRLKYIEGLTDLSDNDDIIRRLKTPEDVIRMKEYRSEEDILNHMQIPIPVGFLNPSLKILTLSYYFNLPIWPGTLPAGLQTLTVGTYFNRPIERGVLPTGLQTLTFGDHFNQPIEPGVLPPGLQTLTFGLNFNQTLEPGVLPTGLQTLTFGGKFDQSIEHGVLPTGLKTLNFGNGFNQLLMPGVLPTSLTTLTFEWNFDQPLMPGVLPTSLTTLTFGYHFDQPIEPGVLPAGLKTLTFGLNFKQNLEPGVLPPGLQTLTINQNLEPGVLPAGLKTLTFGYHFDQPIEPGVLPAGLRALTFGGKFSHPIGPGVLPEGLHTLTFGRTYQRSLIARENLPSNLQRLFVGYTDVLSTII